jgi:hypothetical protein
MLAQEGRLSLAVLSANDADVSSIASLKLATFGLVVEVAADFLSLRFSGGCSTVGIVPF